MLMLREKEAQKTMLTVQLFLFNADFFEENEIA
jgi:hypothetical protein